MSSNLHSIDLDRKCSECFRDLDFTGNAVRYFQLVNCFKIEKVEAEF